MKEEIKNTVGWGCSTFNFEKKHIDTIYEYLLLNKNSIAVAFECYPYEITPTHHYHDVVRLIEKCAYAIRDGVKTSDEYWAKHLKECNDRFDVVKS